MFGTGRSGRLGAVGALVLVVGLAGPALAVADTPGPGVADVVFTPTSVDVTAGPQVVPVTLRVTDAESGVRGGQVQLIAPDPGGGFTPARYTAGFTETDRTSGDA